MLPKYLRVLKALEKGGSIQLFGRKVVMAQTPEGLSVLAMLATRNDTEEVFLPVDIDLNAFISACEQLDEVEIPLVINLKG